MPVDQSAHANRAVDCATDTANKYGAELILLHVMASLGSLSHIPPSFRASTYEHIEATEANMLKRVAEEILQRAEERARGQEAKQVRTSIDVGHPAQAIVALPEAEGADLIMMGRRGLGSTSGLLMGSVSQKVAHLSECACMTVV